MPTRLIAQALLLSLGCCVRTEIHAAPLSAERPRPRSIAVAPLDNLTGNDQAAQIITDSLQAELARRSSTRVVDGATLASTTFRGPVERSRAQELGRRLEVDAVLYGDLVEFETFAGPPQYRGQVPAVTLELRLVSSRTGSVLWAGNAMSSTRLLVTYNNLTLPELAQHLAHEMVEELLPHLEPWEERARPGEAKPAIVEHPAASTAAPPLPTPPNASPPGESKP